MGDSKTKQVPDESSVLVSEDTEDTDSSSGYRRFALVAFAAILGYGTVADAEAAALRVFPSAEDLSLNISITIPSPVAPIQGNNPQGQGNGTCTQGTPGDNAGVPGEGGSNC